MNVRLLYLEDSIKRESLKNPLKRELAELVIKSKLFLVKVQRAVVGADLEAIKGIRTRLN